MKILLTGSASGIGKALQEEYLKNNHHVYTIDINNENNITNNLTSFKCDITNEEELKKVFDYLKTNLNTETTLNGPNGYDTTLLYGMFNSLSVIPLTCYCYLLSRCTY